MDVIARTAFGIDIDTQSTTDHPFISHAEAFFGVPRKRSKLMQQFVMGSMCKFAYNEYNRWFDYQYFLFFEKNYYYLSKVILLVASLELMPRLPIHSNRNKVEGGRVNYAY